MLNKYLIVFLMLTFLLTACSTKEETTIQTSETLESQVVEKVKPDAKVFSLQPVSKSMVKGSEFNLVVKGYDVNGNEIELSQVDFTSSEPTIIDIDNNGTVKALKVGLSEITARYEGFELSSAIEVFNNQTEVDENSFESTEIWEPLFTNGYLELGVTLQEDYMMDGVYSAYFMFENISKEPIIVDPEFLTLVGQNNLKSKPAGDGPLFDRTTIKPGDSFYNGQVTFVLDTPNTGLSESQVIKAKQLIYDDGINPKIIIDLSNWIYRR